ncbi:hypothetical protein VOLCADRAFT_71831, partial [Volvox carteri f. nagariensis]
AFVMELADILVLGTSAARRAGSSPAEGIDLTFKVKAKFVICIILNMYHIYINMYHIYI